jgi:hypothetical protein
VIVKSVAIRVDDLGPKCSDQLKLSGHLLVSFRVSFHLLCIIPRSRFLQGSPTVKEGCQ